ncbi:hypothetical protein KAU11_03305 [Candidatus Babeliales bacterium]|nr:hypothetical protein [Candidatus Babeliales bacterium]
MKTTRIIFSLPAALTKKLKPLVDEATASKGTTSFVVQIFDGAAKGLYLDQNDALAARKILTKMWDTAEPIKFI